MAPPPGQRAIAQRWPAAFEEVAGAAGLAGATILLRYKEYKVKARTYRKHVANRLKEEQDALLSSTIAAPARRNPASSAVAAITAELPGLLAVAVVEAGSGLVLAAHAGALGFDPATAAVYNAQVIKQKQAALTALKLKDETIEDILITLTNQLHLLKLSADGQQFLYLVVNPRDTSLALAREVLRTHANQLD